MATEIQPRTLEADSSEALINAQLQRTRSQVKSVEFGQRILKLVVGVLIFFLLATLLDHWVVSEGLPIWARVMLWLTLIAGILWYSIKALLPLLLYRVNPLYAARTIEETKPSLKNSLINYLTLRTEQERLPTVIYDAIAKQAATGVKDASVDHAVDHAPLIRWGYLLLGITFCFALYFVLSPKNPFRTVARVIVPWAELTAPSRVQIVEVTPGSAQLYRGKTVKVSARIEGLDVDEPVTLHYTTADGQQREQPIKLKLDELRNHSTLLPAPAEKQASVVAPPRELAGLQQDFEYYITAGDARSQTFRVQIAPAPYIGVERIEYKYPAYTKKPAETRQGEVNIEALEGTTVTIHGTANQPLKKAWIELRDNAGKPARFPDMKITDQTASGSWTIGWKDPQTRDLPDFASYALRFKNQQGHENPEPIAYPVKVVRDEPPTIDILAPTSTEITVPWDQPITFEVRAPGSGLWTLGGKVAWQARRQADLFAKHRQLRCSECPSGEPAAKIYTDSQGTRLACRRCHRLLGDGH
jgi:collagen type III alpha